MPQTLRRPRGVQGAAPSARDQGASWKDLRPAGEAPGITSVEVGKALNAGFQKVSCAEAGRLTNVRFPEEHDAWLKTQKKTAS